MGDELRVAIPLLMATATTFAIVLRSPAGKDESSPGGAPPTAPPTSRPTVVAAGVLFVALYLGVFQALSLYGEFPESSLEGLPWWQFFVLHSLLLLALGVWYAAAWRHSKGEFGVRAAARELGMRARSPWLVELLLGVGAGAAGWVAALSATAVVAAAAAAVSPELLGQEAPQAVVDLAGLSLLLRFAISLSAGVCEELFFRGFLQPRLGIATTTAVFLVAHAGYEQPFMMVGLLVLSVLFGILRRRFSVWVAVWAHATFDAVQLLLFVPFVLRQIP